VPVAVLGVWGFSVSTEELTGETSDFTGWWQLKYFLEFSSLFGEMIHNLFDQYFSNGLVQPPTQIYQGLLGKRMDLDGVDLPMQMHL